MSLKRILAAAAFIGAALFSTSASAAECTAYETSHPAFLLDGAHLSTGKCGSCATCHRGGVFVGTPRTCIECHNGDPTRVTVGRSASHIPTGLVDCASCHKTTSFTSNVNMDHTAVTAQACSTCHSGSFSSYGARGKTNEHIPTTAECNSCHTTRNWDVSHNAIHAGITTGCVTCHNDSYAPGKASYSAGHPVTSDQCELCHSTTANFKCALLLDIMHNDMRKAIIAALKNKDLNRFLI